MLNDIKVGDAVIFNERVFKSPYVPYYDKYKGHSFVVAEFHWEDGADHDHVWLNCTSDPSITMDGYVDTSDLIKV